MKERAYLLSAISFHILSILNFTRHNYMWSVLFLAAGIFYVWKILCKFRLRKNNNYFIIKDKIQKKEVLEDIKHTLSIYRKTAARIKFFSIIGWGLIIFFGFYNIQFSIACSIIMLFFIYKYYYYHKVIALIENGIKKVNTT
ncbi:MAG TPA: hypothetical protein GXX35_15640 [Thermoanaerobacterales bacterium]|nr:hypothetical protein [Thermoanaerobacterales bacterium]